MEGGITALFTHYANAEPASKRLSGKAGVVEAQGGALADADGSPEASPVVWRVNYDEFHRR